MDTVDLRGEKSTALEHESTVAAASFRYQTATEIESRIGIHVHRRAILLP
jgi:hypothetical protein